MEIKLKIGFLFCLVFFSAQIIAQERQISGQVTDEEGMPLPGVSIHLKETTTGTVTNFDGEFSLSVPDENEEVLVFSFLGYETKEVKLENETTFEVVLSESEESLDEVLIVGYGTQRRENVTGAISQINSEEINNRSANNVTQILQGLAPNLNIDATAQGGTADANMSINIRGVGSLSSSDPHIRINDVRATQAQLAALNPMDIESVSVLKDAAASAIYGAQAAFGVILVTTKEGTKNQGFSISLTSDTRLERPMFVPETVNSLQLAEAANDASRNIGQGDRFSEAQIANIRSFMEGNFQYGTAPDPNNSNQWLGIGGGTADDWYSGFANTDWFDVMYKDVAISQKHDVSVTGGNEDITYYVSGGLLQDNGQLQYGDDNEYYKRYNLNSKISADITDWLTVSNITRFSQEGNRFPATLEGGSRGRLFHDIMRWPSIVPLKTPAVADSEGNLLVPEQLTTLAAFNEYNGFNEYKVDDLVSTFKAEIDLTEGLILRGDFTFMKHWRNRTLNFKEWNFFGPDGAPSITYQANDNQIKKDWRRTNYTSFNIYADYIRTFFENHNFQVLTGYQQEENHFEGVEVGRYEVVANNLNTVNAAVGEIIGPSNPISSWSTLGAFARFKYDFKEKYLFEFNGRYDGSSRFAEGNRFGFFPSIAIGYNLHNERFWNSIDGVINTMKIRASWGTLGNQNVANNLYLSSIPIRSQLPWIIGGERPVYTSMPAITSPNITWETTTTKNLGLDLSFLDNRLSASIDVYERQTDNMFGPVAALPGVLGTTPPRTNSASLNTKGGELELGWRDRIDDFDYNFNFMLSDNISTIIKYHNPNMVLSNWYEGQVLGEIWGFEAENLFQSEDEVEEYLSRTDLSYLGSNWQPGNVKYKDLNGDGAVDIGENTLAEPGDRRIIGNNTPRYRFSIQGGASWKNFDFNMLWQGVGKRDVLMDSYATLFWGWNGQGHSRITEPSLDYWSEENPDAYLPIPLDRGGGSGFAKDRRASTRYLQDGAYVRLKSLNIGYTLPSSFNERLKINNIRIYLSGENLLTYTKMWPTIDPELSVVGGQGIGGRTSGGRAYPLSQVYAFGFNISF